MALEFPSFFAYVAGPILGGVLAALTYAKVLARISPPQPQAGRRAHRQS